MSPVLIGYKGTPCEIIDDIVYTHPSHLSNPKLIILKTNGRMNPEIIYTIDINFRALFGSVNKNEMKYENKVCAGPKKHIKDINAPISF